MTDAGNEVNIALEEAQRRRVCRVCGEPLCARGPMGGDPLPRGWTRDYAELLYPVHVILNYGAECAHAKCLTPRVSKAVSAPPVLVLAPELQSRSRAPASTPGRSCAGALWNSRNVKFTKLLSILTPAVPSRFGQIEKLMLELHRQIRDLPVEHLVLLDNKRRTVGEKRDALLRAARGEYISYVDDDDYVSNDYVFSLLAAIESLLSARVAATMAATSAPATTEPTGC